MLVPGVVAGLIWIFLTSVDFGLFNTILKAVGVKPVTWLGAGSALPVLAALDVWRSLGYWAIFFLAAIIGLPQELYQAAELDGAGPWQRFRFLTLPLLRRILLFAIVVSTIFGLQVFDTALVLTDGGPGTATTTIVYRVWRYVFGESDKVGIGAAISLVLLVAILTLTLVQMRVLRGRARGGLTWRPPKAPLPGRRRRLGLEAAAQPRAGTIAGAGGPALTHLTLLLVVIHPGGALLST